MGNCKFSNFRSSLWKIALCAGAACVFILLGGAAMTAYAAEESCADCHDAIAVSFNSSFHAKAWDGANGCQSCHGTMEQHQDDPSPSNIISFNKGSGRTAAELSGQCLKCHTKSSNLTFWGMGQHKANDVECTACHDIHKSRSTVLQPTVCFTCHRDIRSDANKISHHPIIEGKVKCSDCHNTHGTLSKHMINAENTNQLCYKCHADKRGPWIWEHPPVEENCAICHTPHGSRHDTLLVEKVVNLCQDCHDDSSHHGEAYDNTSGFGGSNTDDHFVNRACLQCHHAIHGSANFKRSLSR